MIGFNKVIAMTVSVVITISPMTAVNLKIDPDVFRIPTISIAKNLSSIGNQLNDVLKSTAHSVEKEIADNSPLGTDGSDRQLKAAVPSSDTAAGSLLYL